VISERLGYPRLKKILFFLSKIAIFEKWFVEVVGYRAGPTNLEPSLQKPFVGAAGQLPLQICVL
jgi:hypothetical protein